MNAGAGINTLWINGEIKHIFELDELTLQAEWAKLKKEIDDLYQINAIANSGWRGIILRFLGISLPDKRTIFIGGVTAKGEFPYTE
jgi:hypothetical protein